MPCNKLGDKIHDFINKTCDLDMIMRQLNLSTLILDQVRNLKFAVPLICQTRINSELEGSLQVIFFLVERVLGHDREYQ